MVIGGYLNGEGRPTASVILYDPAEDTWETSAPLPSPRLGCRAMYHACELIVIDGGPPLRYNSRNGTWCEIPEAVLPAHAALDGGQCCLQSGILG